MSEERELETLAVFVHGALFALHALGFVYNVRRGNRLDAAIHLAGVVYDGHAAIEHGRRTSKEG